MKKDTLEEKIVGARQHTALALELPEAVYDAYTTWLRTTLTSYRNDVLEEVLAAFEEYRDPLNDCQNCGMPDSDKLRQRITTLKVEKI